MDQIKTGRLIRALRQGQNLTQAELGEKLGVGGKAVSKWECGAGAPDIALLLRKLYPQWDLSPSSGTTPGRASSTRRSVEMRPELTFTPIDFAAWPRRETFCYFSKMAHTGYSLTVDLDATDLYRTLKAANCRLFPAYLWLVTRNLQRQEEFCLAERDGTLGRFNCLTPLYAAFHEDDKTFSLTVHHAAADGWQVHQFLTALQKDMDRFQDFL